MNKLTTEHTIFAELNNLYCSSYNYGGGNSHANCTKIIDKVLGNISVFTNYNTLLYNLVNGLCKGYYSSCSSTPKSLECFKQILNLVNFDDFTLEQFKKITNSSAYFVEHFSQKVIEREEYSPDLVTKILYTNNTILIDKMLGSKKTIHFIPEHYEIICINSKTYSNKGAAGYSNSGLSENTQLVSTDYNSKLIMELINRKIKVNKNAIICAIMFSIHTNILKQLISMGPELSEDYLVAACYGNNKDMMEFLLDNKIVPNNKCIPALFSKEIKSFIDLSNYNKFTVSKETPYSIKDSGSIKKLSDLVNIILKYNYNLEYNDLLFLTKNFIQINGIERYNIKFDSKFLEVCAEAGFYPNYNHGINPDIKCLQKECGKSGNITAIKDLIKKYKFKPDNICMQNACRIKANLPVIRYLQEQGAPVDEIAVRNITYATGNTSACFVIDNYIKYLENKSKENPVKTVQVEKKEEVQVKENIPVQKVIEPIQDNHDNNDEINDDILSEEELPKKKKIVVKKTKKVKEVIGVEKIEQVKPNKEDYTLIQTKITDKDNIVVPAKFLEYFKLEKDSKLSILSFKKIIINHLNNKKLIQKGNFNIELPEDLLSAISFDSKKYGNIIDIKNLDKFCTFVLDSINNTNISNSPKKN